MNNKVQLKGKCTLQFDTGNSTFKVEIPKNNKHGKNNADSLIGEVLHFAVMRMGTDRLEQVVKEKIAKYNGEFKEQGLFPDEKEKNNER